MVLSIDEGVVLTFTSVLPEDERPDVTPPSSKPDDSSKVSQQTSTPTPEDSTQCKPAGRGEQMQCSQNYMGRGSRTIVLKIFKNDLLVNSGVYHSHHFINLT